jgi:hypothetical protein
VTGGRLSLIAYSISCLMAYGLWLMDMDIVPVPGMINYFGTGAGWIGPSDRSHRQLQQPDI